MKAWPVQKIASLSGIGQALYAFRSTRRRFIQLSAGTLAAAVVGCRPRNPDGMRRSTLIVACPWAERELNAIDGDGGFKNVVFLPLLTDDDTGAPLEGRLAERWEHSPDYRDWTFHLRSNVRWHDGVPVTAHDVKFTVELLSHPGINELSSRDVESIHVLDDATISLRFGSWWGRRSITTGYEMILPKHLLAQLDPKKYAGWDFWNRPVGNGPYRFAHHLPQTMMQFDANPDYYRGRPRIEHVVLKFTQGAAMAELLSGNVDILLGADPAKVAAESSWRAYYGFTGGQIYGILWNNAQPRLSDLQVRRALTLAINRRELARGLNLPESLPILDGPFTPLQVRRAELTEPLPYDPRQARTLLDAAGWAQRGNGMRERDGDSLHFTLLVGNRPGFSQVAVYVQEAWRRVGASVDIQMLDPTAASSRVRAKQFDAFLTFVPMAPAVWQDWFGERQNSPLGYRNADVLRLLERLPLAIDPAEEDDIRRKLTEIFRAEIPATFLFPRVKTVFVRNRVRGLSSPWRVDPLRFMDTLWLDDRSQQ